MLYFEEVGVFVVGYVVVDFIFGCWEYVVDVIVVGFIEEVLDWVLLMVLG